MLAQLIEIIMTTTINIYLKKISLLIVHDPLRQWGRPISPMGCPYRISNHPPWPCWHQDFDFQPNHFQHKPSYRDTIAPHCDTATHRARLNLCPRESPTCWVGFFPHPHQRVLFPFCPNCWFRLIVDVFYSTGKEEMCNRQILLERP